MKIKPIVKRRKKVTPSDKDAIICVDHLTKDYGYGRGVFDVSIQVHKGECYGYLGPNGAGKSTTIRHIMGFSKPQKGTITVFGKESFKNTADILKNVGYLPGEPSIPQGLDGWGFLEMMQTMRGYQHDKEAPRLKYLLELFKLNPAQNVKEMSLGDKRKLAVVAAFMNDPDVLILDEPTSGLDPIMQHVFIDFIVDEKKRGKTILLSSHIFSEVEATCDVISIIKDGKHVSTFKSGEFNLNDNQTYRLYFLTIKEMQRYVDSLNKDVINPVEFNKENKYVAVSYSPKNYQLFFNSLEGFMITKFIEKKFTLQDYFMSFYKEEREFDGLSGVKGNQK